MDTYTEAGKHKRRDRALEEKRQIVEETLAEGASVALVARTHGVNANLLFTWRKLYQAGRLGSGGAKLLPVKVSPESSPSRRRDKPSGATARQCSDEQSTLHPSKPGRTR
jgi:transposase